MKKTFILCFVVCLLLAGCKANTPTNTAVISESGFVLTGDMRSVLNEMIEAYLNADTNHTMSVAEPVLWAYEFTENCVITVSMLDDAYDTENDLFCTLLYRENDTWQAKQFGEDAVCLTSPSQATLLSPCESFVQRVGTTTVVCLGEADSIVQRFGDVKPEHIFDNRDSTKLLLSFAELQKNGTACSWTQACRNENGEYIFLASTVYTECPYGYVFAIDDLDDAYSLTCGSQTYTGADLKNLLK